MKTSLDLTKLRYSFAQMESVCSAFVLAPNTSCSAETAQTVVRSLVPLQLKSGTVVSCLLPLPWLSLCPMLWVSQSQKRPDCKVSRLKKNTGKEKYFSVESVPDLGQYTTAQTTMPLERKRMATP